MRNINPSWLVKRAAQLLQEMTTPSRFVVVPSFPASTALNGRFAYGDVCRLCCKRSLHGISRENLKHLPTSLQAKKHFEIASITPKMSAGLACHGHGLHGANEDEWVALKYTWSSLRLSQPWRASFNYSLCHVIEFLTFAICTVALVLEP